MSLFGALFTGVSALSAQGNSMAMISNNISNVNTVGYKKVYADFSSLVTTSGSNTAYASGGVVANTKSTIAEQGVLQQTTNPTDLAISGDGFFVTRAQPNSSSEILYTRAGSFREDAEGYLRNTAGGVLYAWKLDADGNIPAANANISSLDPVNLSFTGGQTKPTTTAKLAMNLNAAEAIAAGTDFTRAITVFDSLGGSQTLTLNFNKTATNAWTIDILNGSTSLLPDTGGSAAGDPVAVTFNSDGSIHQIGGVSTTSLPVTGINWGNGSASQDITFDLSNITQFNSAYNVVSITQNGAQLGLRTGVEIDENGVVSATFSNGTNAKLYQLPLATFSNTDGLTSQSGNAFSVSFASGDYNLRQPNTSGAGAVSASSLESSNVDLADEFAKMIVTQRAYSAGTKVITTADQMMQELLQVK